MQRIGALFELGFDLDRVDAVGDDTALVRMVVTFTASACESKLSSACPPAPEQASAESTPPAPTNPPIMCDFR